MRRRPVGVVLVFSDLPSEYRDQLRSRAIPFVIIQVFALLIVAAFPELVTWLPDRIYGR